MIRDAIMNKKYCVCALGYDQNDCITDYEHIFGMFDKFTKIRKLIDNNS